ncbi:hypothetical protein [Ruegeria arenilitoris]|uniref:COG3904 family protein n=1 Tax=Ruegeria arenilitoris TaxID=1173585 RepID=UPI00147FC3F9|nr:hypothetical protein [Ruegeria arenilitoris]
MKYLSRFDPRSGLRYVLILQLVIAAVLIFSDVAEEFSNPFKNRVELPSGPVSPGDQRREYRTDRTDPTLFLNDEPQDLPVPANFSARLDFSVSELDEFGQVLLLSGQIETGDADRLISYLSEMTENPALVALHSPGGRVSEALTIGQHLREAGVNTGVLAGSVCMSSCPYILAGGIDRLVSQKGVVGMHQHYYEQPRMIPVVFAVEGIQKGQGETMQHLIEMGIDPALMLYSLNTPPEQIYALVADELIQTRLATQIIE